jgi:hypothetical protein
MINLKKRPKRPLNGVLFVPHAIFCLTNYLHILIYVWLKKNAYMFMCWCLFLSGNTITIVLSRQKSLFHSQTEIIYNTT